MSQDKKSSLRRASGDNLSKMPKDTAGQRVKYLLAKYGKTQKEFAVMMYDGDEEKGAAQYTNINAKLNDKRSITYEDAEKISAMFDTYPQFILKGGYENNADMLQHIISETEAETDLLHAAFRSLSSLSGYNIKRIGYETGTPEMVTASLYDYAEVERDGITMTLSIDQLNELENIICEHAEITIRRYLKANGKEVR